MGVILGHLRRQISRCFGDGPFAGIWLVRVGAKRIPKVTNGIHLGAFGEHRCSCMHRTIILTVGGSSERFLVEHSVDNVFQHAFQNFADFGSQWGQLGALGDGTLFGFVRSDVDF